MIKQLTIQCGKVRKTFQIETELSDYDIVSLVDVLDLFRKTTPLSKHLFILGDNE